MTRWRKIEELKDINGVILTIYSEYTKYHYHDCYWKENGWYHYKTQSYVTMPTHCLEITPPSDKEMERERLVTDLISKWTVFNKWKSDFVKGKIKDIDPSFAMHVKQAEINDLLDQLTETEGE